MDKALGMLFIQFVWFEIGKLPRVNMLGHCLFMKQLYKGPSEVHALPIRCCRRAAWQTLVATINGVILLLLLFSSGSVTFLPEGVVLRF